MCNQLRETEKDIDVLGDIIEKVQLTGWIWDCRVTSIVWPVVWLTYYVRYSSDAWRNVASTITWQSRKKSIESFVHATIFVCMDSVFSYTDKQVWLFWYWRLEWVIWQRFNRSLDWKFPVHLNTDSLFNEANFNSGFSPFFFQITGHYECLSSGSSQVIQPQT